MTATARSHRPPRSAPLDAEAARPPRARANSTAPASRSHSPRSPADARVSRQFLYSHDALRAEIEPAPRPPDRSPAPVPARERASDDSLRTRLRAALDDNQRLRNEITRLRDELALALGRVRELELHAQNRLTATDVVDMSTTRIP